VSSKAKDVFDQIVEHVKLKETIYFGLTQVKGIVVIYSILCFFLQTSKWKQVL